MNFHLENQIVEIVVPYQAPNGEAIVPTEISAVLYDGEDRMITDFGVISHNPVEVEAKIVILGAMNALNGDELVEARRLDVRIVHAGGSFMRSHRYGLEAEQSLQIMRNSFMTFETAEVLARQFVNLGAFSTAPDDRKRAALVEAYRRITTLPMIYSILNADGCVISEHSIGRTVWSEIDADVYQTQFPSHFKRALRTAQLSEADDLLQGNVVARKHAQGIVSETIGESSVTLRAGFSGAGSSDLGSSALAHLRGYIDNSVKIGRA